MSEVLSSKMIRLGGQPTIWCPGCNEYHRFDERWTWNGDPDKPTFSPSFLSTGNYGPEQEKQVCHSFVRNGEWQYLSDCTHELSGQTVPVPDIPADKLDWAWSGD